MPASDVSNVLSTDILCQVNHMWQPNHIINEYYFHFTLTQKICFTILNIYWKIRNQLKEEKKYSLVSFMQLKIKLFVLRFNLF